MTVLKTTSKPELIRRPAAQKKIDFRAKFAIFLLYGFFFLWKAFVYPAFALTALVFFDRRVLLDPVYSALTKKGPLSMLCWALLVSTIFGVGGVIYGVAVGNEPFIALEVFAFNISPWFLLVGLHAGVQRPDVARSYIRFLAWGQAITTPIYFLVFRGAGIDMFQPGSGAVMLLGIFCFEANLARYWFPIVVSAFDTLASEIRGDWAGLLLACVVWAMAAKQMKRVLAMAGIIVILLGVGALLDVRLPGLPGRGGEISARDTLGRAISSVDPEWANEFSNNSGVYAGTVQWRKRWWQAIREQVFATPLTTVFGLGYGYPIGNLVSYIKGDVRTPHSVIYFILAYSGLVGWALFAWFQFALLRVLWKVFKETGQIFGFAALVFFLVSSSFGNFFESPQRAVPTYLLLGMCIGPLLASRDKRSTAGALPDWQRQGALTSPLQAPPPPPQPAGGWAPHLVVLDGSRFPR